MLLPVNLCQSPTSTARANPVRVILKISARVQENLSGVRVIKAFTQEESEINEFKRLNQEYIQKNRDSYGSGASFIRCWVFCLGLGEGYSSCGTAVAK